MKKIYKYVLEKTDYQEIKLRGKPLNIRNQNENLCLYALIDEDEPEKNYQIWTAGTGHNIPNGIIENFTFLGTVMFYHGGLVFHIFYREVNDETSNNNQE